jgi:hypothetical protein
MRLTQVKECVRHFRTGSNQPGISSGTIPRLKAEGRNAALRETVIFASKTTVV